METTRIWKVSLKERLFPLSIFLSLTKFYSIMLFGRNIHFLVYTVIHYLETRLFPRAHQGYICYLGEANSIRLCDEHSVNSQTLSISYRYFKGNSHMIRLDVDVRDSFNSLGTGSTHCLGKFRIMYECTTSNIRIIFTCRIYVLFAFRCKPTFTFCILPNVEHSSQVFVYFFLHLSLSRGVHATVFTKPAVTRDLLDVLTLVVNGPLWNTCDKSVKNEIIRL